MGPDNPGPDNPGPDYPGKYGRTYGDAILRHVLHVKPSTKTYNELN